MPIVIDYEIPVPFYLLKLDGYSPVFRVELHILIERFTGKSYVYKAVNLKTREVISLFYTKTQLTERKHKAAAEKIMTVCESLTDIAKQYAALKTGLELLTEKARVIFAHVLTKNGYTIRQKQMELSIQMLTALHGNRIHMSEAAVGIGKTHAYLIAAVLFKLDGRNDFWIRCGYPPSHDFHPDTPMPVVISTSSIALQRAITQDYIPDISRILLESGFINRPLSCVIRKGKQHYLCDIRLEDYLPHADAAVKPALAGLLSGDAKLDLDEAELLSAYVKRKICVTDNCNSQCPKREDCRYLTFMKNAQTGRFDFQVCNHQYLLADLIRREQEAKPLIPNYQAVIIDEAHKLEQAAQGMYSTVFSNREIPAITRYIRTLTLADKKLTQYLPCYGDKLMALNNQLFMELCGGLPASGFFNDETERFQALYTDKAKTLIRSLRHALDTLRERLDVTDTDSSVVSSRQENLYAYILYALKRLSERLKVFQSPGEIIYWLEIPKLTRKVTSEISFCNIPKKLGRFLYRDLWTKRFPVLLTSGTLAAGGSFFHAKKRLGLELIVKERVTETVKPSPFNYEKNCLLYISEDVPYPDNQSHEYIESVSEEIERLINASRGHAAVLFTSYRVMEAVYQMIEGRELGYPLFKLNRNDNGIIGQFKESGNGVLFASGSLWEGIDLPGDILSMLVIVKLPFQVPDPLSEYEQSLYNDEADYKRFVVLPDMLLKLKQGFGRLIRREDDTGVVAILDYRVRIEGTYREAVLQALPKCRVTDSVKTVEQFICHMKSDKYFSGGSDYGV